MFTVEKVVDGKKVTKKLRHAVDAAEYKAAGWKLVSVPTLKDDEGEPLLDESGNPIKAKVPTGKDVAKQPDHPDVHGEKPGESEDAATDDSAESGQADDVGADAGGDADQGSSEGEPTKAEMLETLEKAGQKMHHKSGDAKVKEAYDALIASQAE